MSRERTTSVKMDDAVDAADTTKPKTWWDENPGADRFESTELYLDLHSKSLSSALFGLLDTTGDGILSAEDFAPSNLLGDGHREALHNFRALQHELDSSGDAQISPSEFLKGLKKLAMKQPINEAYFTKDSAKSHLEMQMRLNDSINDAFKKVSIQLLQGLLVFDGATTQALERAWASLDVDGDGKVTPADFAGDTAAIQKWGIVKSTLDRDGDGEITTTEFLEAMKSQATLTVSGSAAGNFKNADLNLAGFNSLVNLEIVTWCGSILQNVAPTAGLKRQGSGFVHTPGEPSEGGSPFKKPMI